MQDEETGENAPGAEAGAPGDVIRLHATPRAAETEELLQRLRAAPDDAPLVVDAGAVEAVGTPYILALAAASRARAEAGSPMAVISPPAALIDAFSDLGLFQDLMNMEFRP